MSVSVDEATQKLARKIHIIKYNNFNILVKNNSKYYNSVGVLLFRFTKILLIVASQLLLLGIIKFYVKY